MVSKRAQFVLDRLNQCLTRINYWYRRNPDVSRFWEDRARIYRLKLLVHQKLGEAPEIYCNGLLC